MKPDKEFDCSSMVVISVNCQNVAGIVPVRQFSCRNSSVTFVSDVNDEGRGPFNLFCLRSTLNRLDNDPIYIGIDPPIPLFLRFSASNATMFPTDIGKVSTI